MPTAQQHAIGAYRRFDAESRVGTASPHGLIALLYDGALTALAQARAYMQSDDTPAKGAALSVAIGILQEGLIGGLNPETGGGLALDLHALYEYMTRRLLTANLTNDITVLDEVSGLLRGLKGAWNTIDPQARVGAAGGATS